MSSKSKKKQTPTPTRVEIRGVTPPAAAPVLDAVIAPAAGEVVMPDLHLSPEDEQAAATGGMPLPRAYTAPEKEAYAFPTKSRCPRCGSLQTQATRTNGDIQYRKCSMSVCRHTYSVFGKKI